MIFGNWRPWGAAAALPPVRLLERARPTPAGVLRLGRRALPGAPVRAHADRGRRRDRPLDPAGSGRTPLQEVVTRNARAAWSVVLGLLAAATMPVAIVATRYSDVLRAPARRLRDPGRGRARRSSPSCSPAARGRSTGRRSGKAGRRRRRRESGRLLGILGSAWRPRRRSRSPSTSCSSPSSRSRDASPGAGQVVGPGERRLHCTFPCSRSAPACARPGPARASTSTTWRCARRSVRSTCAPSRRSSSTSSRGTRTSRASCARTPTRSGWTGSCTWTSTTRASSRARRSSPSTRAGRRRGRGAAPTSGTSRGSSRSRSPRSCSSRRS